MQLDMISSIAIDGKGYRPGIGATLCNRYTMGENERIFPEPSTVFHY